jgi:hypothetical protein
MQYLNEELLAGDLDRLVDHIFEIDSYTSKMGSDEDVVVLSFSLHSLKSSQDLVNFVERGYEFVLDADYTPGELNDGKYKVYVELERNKRIAEHIIEILDGIKKLANIDKFKFRYYKAFHSIPVDLESLKEYVPASANDYKIRKDQQYLNNFSNFFNRSYLENINVEDDDIIFQKRYAEPLRMRIMAYGKKNEIYDNVPGKIMFEHSDIGEILFLTKYIGEYNISKIGGMFVFEHDDNALVLQKV